MVFGCPVLIISHEVCQVRIWVSILVFPNVAPHFHMQLQVILNIRIDKQYSVPVLVVTVDKLLGNSFKLLHTLF